MKRRICSVALAMFLLLGFDATAPAAVVVRHGSVHHRAAARGVAPRPVAPVAVAGGAVSASRTVVRGPVIGPRWVRW